MPLDSLLRRAVRAGTLVVRDTRGHVRRYGNGGGPEVAVRIADARTERRLLLDPHMALGEAYVDGALALETGEVADLLDLLARNLGSDYRRTHWLVRLARASRHALRRAGQWTPVASARRNAAHHYDLSGDLYALFLDSDRQYSCAYFEHENDSLERAQEQKKRHVAAKLALEPGMRVLDIGCGWGGLALYLARRCGARVVGITLSHEQARVARERVAREGLEDRVEIRLQDYRETRERFERIVSVGMFEHVGLNQYRGFFRTLYDRLAEDGVALVHSIVRLDGPAATNRWIAKYIFPGGYIPAVSEVLPAVERAGLLLTDLELWRLHYARTLAHWRRRFKASWGKAARLYDERFCRMWEFYLAGSEAAFRHGGLSVGQFQIARSLEALPLTRDYIDALKRKTPVEAN